MELNHRKKVPEWYSHITNNFKEGKLINKQWKPFWDKVHELQEKGIECNCGCDERDPNWECIKCRLKKTKRYNWTWLFGKRDTFICISKELDEKCKKHRENEEWWVITMARTRGDIWSVLRKYFYDIQDNICPECGEVFEIEDMELHHKLAINLGGRESSDNLILLCKPCHHKHILEAYD